MSCQQKSGRSQKHIAENGGNPIIPPGSGLHLPDVSLITFQPNCPTEVIPTSGYGAQRVWDNLESDKPTHLFKYL